MERIASRSNPRIKELCALRKGDSPLFLVEGFHLVEMASSSSCLLEVYSLKPYSGAKKCTLISPEVLQKLCLSKTPEGIVGVCKKKQSKELSSPRVLLLDRVQDPGNVGTLLRTALAFSFKDVISLSGTASFYSNKVVASSQGALFRLNLQEGKGEEEAVEELKKQGYFLLGSALEDATDFHSLPFLGEKVCLILGNEGRGMSPYLLSHSDRNAYIPIQGIDSLNVGVAGGILMEKLRS